MEEFAVGDVVLLKNRDNQTLDAPLAGPFEFVRYKDLKKSAAIITDAVLGYDYIHSYVIGIHLS